MSRRNIVHALALSAVVLVLTACGSVSDSSDSAQFSTLGTTVEMSTEWAQRGDVVSVKISGAKTKGAEVDVAGLPAAVTIISGSELEFVVPADAPIKDEQQQVLLKLSDQTLLEYISIFGDDIIENEFALVVSPDTTVDDLLAALNGISFEILEGPLPLDPDFALAGGTCSGSLFRIKVAGMDTGEALTELKSRTDGFGGTIWHSDPQSDYSTGAIDHLAAVGAKQAQLRNLNGAGTLIAVIDTGVSDHGELGARLLTDEGYDFVSEEKPAEDEYSKKVTVDGEEKVLYGHGTPIAVLAAGGTTGVAPEAKVVPIRVCDSEGHCYTADVLRGICHALSKAHGRDEGMGNLVINLSLGGYTPVESIRSALQFAISNGTLVAAAGGNDRKKDSPAHYPAAYSAGFCTDCEDGLVAVAALRQTETGAWEQASFSNRGPYLDIAAPGVNLTTGDSDGFYSSGFTGTSYATALTSGALAIWRDARPYDPDDPATNSARIERGLWDAAKDLGSDTEAYGAGMLNLENEPK